MHRTNDNLPDASKSSSIRHKNIWGENAQDETVATHREMATQSLNVYTSPTPYRSCHKASLIVR
jgi:hypothetical protein